MSDSSRIKPYDYLRIEVERGIIKSQSLPITDLGKLDEFLVMAGIAGWELVTGVTKSIPWGYPQEYIFKREIY